MQNKNNTIIIVILIIIAAALIFIALRKPKTEVIEISTDNTPVVQQTNNGLQTTTWVTSSMFNLEYPQGVDVFETKNPYAEVRFTYDGAVISWGGGVDTSCMPDGNEYGVFQPGVSTVACVKGQTARIGLENVRNTISQKALDMFAEFVLKNK